MRPVRLISLYVYLCFLFTCQVYPQAIQPAPIQDPQAALVLQQCALAMSTSGNSIRDSIALGTVKYADGSTAAITIKTLGRATRNEITSNGTTSTVVLSDAGNFHVVAGQKTDLPAYVPTYQRPEHIPALSRLTDPSLSQSKIAYLGTEVVGGVAVHHIRIIALPTDGTPAELLELISEFHLFVDPKSFQVVKTRSFIFSSDGPKNRSAIDTYFSDYRNVAGVLVPFHLTRQISGNPYYEITFSSIAINAGVSPADFE